MTITIKDIAREAGVSHSTVSRALSGSHLITDETAERIRRVASKLGYLPSAAARTLKTNRSQALGVILRNVDDPFFGEILQGIEDVAQASGYSLFIAASQRNPEREQGIVQAMAERQVDGVIICSTTFSGEQSGRLARLGVPIVVVNNQSAEEYRYSIYHDDVDGSRQVTHHLIELGHGKIAFLGNSIAGRTTLDRLTGFQSAMNASGLTVPTEYIYEVPGGGPDEGFTAAGYFLGLADPPTALVCYNDMLAIGMMSGLQKVGIRVPDEFSITGFDNIIFSAYTTPPLTTFDQPKRTIGEQAARLVLGLLDDNEAPGPKIQTLRGRLLMRGSTARLAR